MAASAYGWLLTSTVYLIILLLLIPLVLGDPRNPLVARSCRRTDPRNATMFNYLYQNLISQMEDEMWKNKYSAKEDGVAPERVYILSQCMDDLSARECRDCFKTVAAFLPSCFPAVGGRVYTDGCFIRVESYSFFQESLSPDDQKKCSASRESNPQYSSVASKLIYVLTMKAPDHNGALTMHHQKSASGVTVYGMASCLKTLDREMCSACLANAAPSALSCLPSTEGRVLNAGCSLRYSNYKFTNGATTTQKEDECHAKYYNISIIGGVLVSVILVALIGIYVCMIMQKQNTDSTNEKRFEMSLSSLVSGNVNFMKFKYTTLEQATECFSESCRLGQGGYGEVFKGTLKDGREIAVKRLFMSGGQAQTDEVYNEMVIISKAQHQNLVHFLGCCFNKSENFLVYEFLANKSLDCLLFDSEKKKELDWPKRRKIITGTAEGLEYLHKHCPVQIIHRDIKASNILLDLNHRPKIADFGLARFYSCDKNFDSTVIAGTLGYMAPEYLAEGRLTEKVDVYSFGLLLFEIISGMQNSQFRAADIFDTLVAHAWKCYKSRSVTEIVDKDMEGKDIEEIQRFSHVGLLCVQQVPGLRPDMTTVIQMLKQKDTALPEPTRPPFTYKSCDSNCSLNSRMNWRRRSSMSTVYFDFEQEPE